MERQSLADLAREYGLDARQYQDQYDGDYVAGYDEPSGFDQFEDSGYGDAEIYEEGKQNSLVKESYVKIFCCDSCILFPMPS